MTTRCLDSTLLIDLLRGSRAAVQRTQTLQESGELLKTAAPCVAELLRGVHFSGKKLREAAEGLLNQLEVLPVDERAARRAGEFAAETARRGREVGLIDCLVAAVTIVDEAILVTRDSDFARIPGLSIETY